MSKKSKKTGQEGPRPDLNLNDDDFIVPIQRPNLEQTRTQFVLDGYARGLTLESLQQGSGFEMGHIKKLLQLDEYRAKGR